MRSGLKLLFCLLLGSWCSAYAQSSTDSLLTLSLIHIFTNDVALSITDFATEDTVSERKLIWNNQVDYLISVLGA